MTFEQNPEEIQKIESRLQEISGYGPWEGKEAYGMLFFISTLYGLNDYNQGYSYENSLEAAENKGLPKHLLMHSYEGRDSFAEAIYIRSPYRDRPNPLEYIKETLDKLELHKEVIREMFVEMALNTAPHLFVSKKMNQFVIEQFETDGLKSGDEINFNKIYRDIDNNPEKQKTSRLWHFSQQANGTTKEFIDTLINTEKQVGFPEDSRLAKEFLNLFADFVPQNLKSYIDEQRKNHKSPEKDNPGDVIVNLMVIGGKSKGTGLHSA